MKNIKFSAYVILVIIIAMIFLGAGPCWSGSIFLTGHDPDYHGSPREFSHRNPSGARNINKAAIDFVTDPTFNPFTQEGVSKFLFVESNISIPTGHRRGINGITASGFNVGTDFEQHDFVTLEEELGKLGAKYNALVVASDFGGTLTKAELDILNVQSDIIIDFLNDGGGLYAMAESNGGAKLTSDKGRFGFLPFVVSSTAFTQEESGFTLTSFGESLGLTNGDVNGNVTHNIFLDDFGLEVVDYDNSRNILSLAGRGIVDPIEGVKAIPEPCTLLLLGSGLLVLRYKSSRI